jgi:hypothetical protein
VNSLHARVWVLVSRCCHPHPFGQRDITATPSGVIGSSRALSGQGVMHTPGSFCSNRQVKSKTWLNDEDRVGGTEGGVPQSI